ncbi:hypothetical protein VTN00DRAFT_7390 [Thermoascus crustaceus]|uniref:uncharacterized protein n=1 Tax=Thermoascus crustaceus TaxID=5088 RepID=UPI003741F5E9
MAKDARHHNRLLVKVIDENAERTPEVILIRYAGSDWETAGYKTITWKQLAGAINKAAYWLDARLCIGRTHTIAYLGPNDARYYFLLGGAIKTGRRLLIPDGRVTVEGTLSLLDQTQCNLLITADEQIEKAKELVAVRPELEIITIPSLEHFMDNESTPHYPYTKTWDETKDEIAYIIHTSGTTGRPKPIYHTNGFIGIWGTYEYLAQRHWPKRLTYDHIFDSCLLTTCPPQWIAGIASLFFTAFNRAVIVTLPTDMVFPLKVQDVVKIIQANHVTGLFTPPSLIEDFSHDETAFSVLKGLDFVMFAGAQLDQAVGDILSRFTNLHTVIGSTETGPQPSFQSADPSAWNTFDFIPETGARFEPVSGSDDLYELYLDRHPESELFQGGFNVFRDRDSIPTHELYSPRVFADNTTRWIFHSRSDDLVKLSWLAKFSATDIEDAIARHPRVRSVYTGGEGRDVPFIIIELHDRHCLDENNNGINNNNKNNTNNPSPSSQTELLDEIYNQAITAVNANGIGEICIPRETVMLADPAKPFPRTVKMTIIRKEVERCYAEKIEAMYRRWEEVRKTKKREVQHGVDGIK